MKQGTCPKCGSAEIRKEEAGSARDFLPGGNLFNPIHLVNYACTTCGYLESYVVGTDLELLKEKWATVAKRAYTP